MMYSAIANYRSSFPAAASKRVFSDFEPDVAKSGIVTMKTVSDDEDDEGEFQKNYRSQPKSKRLRGSSVSYNEVFLAFGRKFVRRIPPLTPFFFIDIIGRSHPQFRTIPTTTKWAHTRPRGPQGLVHKLNTRRSPTKNTGTKFPTTVAVHWSVWLTVIMKDLSNV